MTPERDVVIVGGGASGALLGAEIVRRGGAVTIVEPSAVIGTGVAYATTCPLHLLNVPANRMSARADAPGDFVAWLAANGHPYGPTAFVPRAIYGAYLRSVTETVARSAGARWRHVRARATDAAVDRGGATVFCDDGTTVRGAALVLALGNPRPSVWPRISDEARASGRFFASAWDAGATTPGEPDESVLLLGSGLTAVDAVLALRDRGHRGSITMLSRRGLLPHEHRLFDAPPVACPEAESFLDLLGAVRRAPTDDWRLAFDALRGETNARWQALHVDEQRRFLRHVLPYWNVHRHRMAPEAAKTIAELIADGTLRPLAGRTETITVAGGALRVPVRPRGEETRIALDVARAINCSGPAHDVRQIENPLLQRLLERGTIVPHVLRLGVAVTADGRLIDADGAPSDRLFAIGPVRFGTLIETTAIPEIRLQASELGARLAEAPQPLTDAAGAA